jgi:hypothetical protein
MASWSENDPTPSKGGFIAAVTIVCAFTTGLLADQLPLLEASRDRRFFNQRETRNGQKQPTATNRRWALDLDVHGIPSRPTDPPVALAVAVIQVRGCAGVQRRSIPGRNWQSSPQKVRRMFVDGRRRPTAHLAFVQVRALQPSTTNASPYAGSVPGL